MNFVHEFGVDIVDVFIRLDWLSDGKFASYVIYRNSEGILLYSRSGETRVKR